MSKPVITSGLQPQSSNREAIRERYWSNQGKIIECLGSLVTRLLPAFFGVAVATNLLEPATGVVASFATAKLAEKYLESVGDGIRALAAFQPTNEAARLSWQLVERALRRTTEDVTGGLQDYIDTVPVETSETLDFKVIETKMQFSRWVLPIDFFSNPAQLPLLDDIAQNILLPWLVEQGVNPARIRTLLFRFNVSFAEALHAEWQSSPEQYEPIRKGFQTPFSDPVEREAKWLRYYHFLQAETCRSAFGETFGLRDVYVSPRAYYEEITNPGVGRRDLPIPDNIVPIPSIRKRHVELLHQAMEQWVLKETNTRDCLRVLSGDPGNGKSSFARMFAAHIGTQGGVRAVYVPLHNIAFYLNGDFATALRKYLPFCGLPDTDLLAADCHERVFLLLDGLDELAKQGQEMQRLTEDFISEVKSTLERVNQMGRRVIALLGGRTFLIQAVATQFRQPKQIWHLMSYMPVAKQHAEQVLTDLEATDQRDAWWQKYGAAVGQPFTGMPKALQSSGIDPLTAQPLLNYLVARLYTQGKIDSSETKNRNVIYDSLLHDIYERGWGEGNNLHLGSKIAFEEFTAVLEEIGMAVWHGGNSRSTTLAVISERCEQAKLSTALTELEAGENKGLLRLMCAFFIGRSGAPRTGQEGFEFTHKTFGEYLTARRLVFTLEEMHKQRQLHKGGGRSRSGWDDTRALEEWVRQCGDTVIDGDLMPFFRDEIALRDIVTEVAPWQEMIVALFGRVFSHEMPMEKFTGLTFGDTNLKAQTAEAVLLQAHYVCALRTKRCLDWGWGDHTHAYWLSRFCDVLGNLELPLAFVDLRHGIFNSFNLLFSDLRGANLQGTNLQFVTLLSGRYTGADFRRAYVGGAKFINVDLRQTNLSNCLYDSTTDWGDSFPKDRYNMETEGNELHGLFRVKEIVLSPIEQTDAD